MRGRSMLGYCVVAALICAASARSALAQAASPVLEPVEFALGDDTVADAEQGFIVVPENRANPSSRAIELHFVRFASTGENPGAPIVFLSGGPGGSGIDAARGPLYHLFTRLREFGDVIALDQRGSGLSNAVPECVTEHRIPAAQPFDLTAAMPVLTAAAAECGAYWRAQGVDLGGYTAVESARDLEDLRIALGVEKISLLGISYGGRLGLTALREMPGRIDRAIFASLEPPQATMALPEATDAYIARLQTLIDTDPAAAAAYPDLAGLMRRVHAQLEAAPLQVEAPSADGQTMTLGVGKTDLQMLASGAIADNANLLPSLYAGIDSGAGLLPPALPVIARYRRAFDPISFSGQEAVDFSAGASSDRLAQFSAQAAQSLFGDFQIYEREVRTAMGVADLGDAYRAPVEADAPTLVLSGSLDGRYAPEDVAAALQGLSRAEEIIVVNGTHNLLMQSPLVGDAIVAFMRGEEFPGDIALPAPAFPVP